MKNKKQAALAYIVLGASASEQPNMTDKVKRQGYAYGVAMNGKELMGINELSALIAASRGKAPRG